MAKLSQSRRNPLVPLIAELRESAISFRKFQLAQVNPPAINGAGGPVPVAFVGDIIPPVGTYVWCAVLPTVIVALGADVSATPGMICSVTSTSPLQVKSASGQIWDVGRIASWTPATGEFVVVHWEQNPHTAAWTGIVLGSLTGSIIAAPMNPVAAVQAIPEYTTTQPATVSAFAMQVFRDGVASQDPPAFGMHPRSSAVYETAFYYGSKAVMAALPQDIATLRLVLTPRYHPTTVEVHLHGDTSYRGTRPSSLDEWRLPLDATGRIPLPIEWVARLRDPQDEACGFSVTGDEYGELVSLSVDPADGSVTGIPAK